MSRLNFRKNIQEAGHEVRGGTRLLLLVFSSAEDESSLKTFTETLEDEKVIKVLEREVAVVSMDMEKNKKMAGKYNIEWIPTFIVADESGNELERWVGYLPPVEFIEQLMLSKGLAEFHLKRYREAIREFEVLVDEYPDSELVPEAKFYLGAASYKENGTTDAFDDACEMLTTTHPESIWTKKCSVWAHPSKQRKPFVGYDQGGSAGSGAY